jgi:hypothetical protein
MPVSQRSAATCWVLLAVLIATLLGHVCALPLHAHGAPAANPHHGEEHDGGDEAAHIASCDAVASSPIVRPILVVAASTADWIAVPVEAATWLGHDHVGAPPPRSTPLFVLYAALLI